VAAGGRVPERTCVGCRGRAPKAALVRVVRPPGGGAATVDVDGTAPGRGAYLHHDGVCLEQAVRKGSLARALRTGMAEVEVGRLRSLIEAG
jgi:hypothetical protein